MIRWFPKEKTKCSCVPTIYNWVSVLKKGNYNPERHRELLCFCFQKFAYCFLSPLPLQDSGQRQSLLGPGQSHICD